eukprot:344333_1
MTDPVQILKSGMIYDAITVKFLQKLQSNIDPITGVLISIGRGKPIVMRKDKLKKAINKFRNEHNIDSDLINTFHDVKSKKLWECTWQRLYDKYDVKKQQQLIYKKSLPIFYTENEGKTDENYDEKQDDNISDEDSALLQWDSDLMYINHTSVPIITIMGPSRIGKSFLFNAMLKNKFSDSEMSQYEIFETSNSGNTAQTKGAWISLYGEIDDNDDAKNKDSNEFILIDQIPEDDVEMWSTNDVISWFKSLNPKFSNVYKNVIEFVQKNDIDGKQFYKLNDVELLTNQLKMDENHASSLTNILGKRLTNKTDEIEVSKVNQMYLVDMEGLSHGVTEFTKKIFEGCYAVSNVIIWYDIQVMSDSFKKLMRKLHKNMQVIANSNRKPAFLYLLRDGDRCVFDFTVKDKDDKDNKTYVDVFDKWINKHHSCQWLHHMNIFSSIHGYLLDSPTFDNPDTKVEVDLSTALKANKLYDDLYDVLTNNDMDLEMLRGLGKTEIDEFCAECKFTMKQKLKFRKFIKILLQDNTRKHAIKQKQTTQKKLYYEQNTLNGLMNKIKSMTHKTARFANNLYILNDQINHINKDSELSLEKRIAACNSKLRWFLLNEKEEKDDDFAKYGVATYSTVKKMFGLYQRPSLQIKNAIIKFNADAKLVADNFEQGLTSLEKQLKYKNETITDNFRKQLINNKNIIINAIKLRERNNIFSKVAKRIAVGSLVVAGGVALTVATGGFGSATLLASVAGTSASEVLAFGGLYGGCFIVYGTAIAPKTLGKIKEDDLSKLEFYK